MTFHIYSVQRDPNRHTCICVAIERKFSYYIPMEADSVTVRQMENAEFAHLYEVVPEYPVRRAAEIYLSAPNKEVSPKAKEHLEAIMADPAYMYDAALFPPLNVIKDNEMSKANVSRVAADKPQAAGKKPSTAKSAALKAAAEISGQPVGEVKVPKAAAKAGKEYAATDGKADKLAAKAAPAAKKAPKAAAAEAEAKPRGRTPAVDPSARLKVGDTSSVKRGFMAEFVAKAQELEKASRGKGFTGEALIEALVASHEDERAADAGWVKTYLSYSLAPARGILVTA